MFPMPSTVMFGLVVDASTINFDPYKGFHTAPYVRLAMSCKLWIGLVALGRMVSAGEGGKQSEDDGMVPEKGSRPAVCEAAAHVMC
jgi:hypothetical protein